MAGAGYKLFNTGDVLTAAQVNTYLQEQTVMVFANAAARTTALASVLSEGMVSYLKDTDVVEIYTGAAWVSLDDPNAIQNSIVDAKGDLISATADNTPARLAVGSNGDSLVADSSATTGLRYNPPVGSLANPVINGAFDIAQRGTSFTTTGAVAYTLDRWLSRTSSGLGSVVTSQQTTSDTTNLPNIQYCARFRRATSNSNTNDNQFSTSLENVNSSPFIGKTITFSFYARKSANFSGTFSASINSGTGTDETYPYLYTGNATVATSTISLTTTWTRYVLTGTVSSSAKQLGAFFQHTPSGTAGSDDYFEVTGVQIDLGTWTAASAPTFRRSGGTIQGELAACQRYYYLIGSGTDNPICLAAAYNGTGSVYGIIGGKVSMRTAPTLSQTTGTNYYNMVGGNTSDAFDSFTRISQATTEAVRLDLESGVASTQLGAYWWITNNASARIALSAEL